MALAAALVWLGHHRRIFAPGLFALYVAGYSAFRIFEESLRVDSSKYFLGLRLNMYVACILTVAGLAWFVFIQRRGRRAVAAGRTAPELAAGGAQPSRVGATDADGALTEAIVPADPPIPPILPRPHRAAKRPGQPRPTRPPTLRPRTPPLRAGSSRPSAARTPSTGGAAVPRRETALRPGPAPGSRSRRPARAYAEIPAGLAACPARARHQAWPCSGSM